MTQADQIDPPIEPAIEPAAVAVSPEVAALLAAVDRLTASLAEKDAQIDALIGVPEWLALRACDRGGYSYETLRKWCETGVVISRREGGRIYVNTRSLAAHLARLGLAKAIRSR
jgi:hypothetical protein